MAYGDYFVGAIPTKKNHFYQVYKIENGVGVYPQFKDMPGPAASESTIEIKGGLGATQYIVSGAVSATPSYGDSELVGGYLQTYVTGMSMSGVNSLPEMSAYKLQDNYPITEGALSFNTGSKKIYTSGQTIAEETIGDQWWFSMSQHSNDDIWLEETFDGSNKSMGSKLVLPGGGASTLTLEDAYVTPKQGAKAIYAGGDAFFGGGASNSVEHNLGKWFSAGGVGSNTEEDKRCYIRPLKKNRLNGLWTAVNDHRGEKEKWAVYEPYWKFEKVKSVMKFGKYEPTENPEGPEEEQNATPHNTIFNKIFKNMAQGVQMPGPSGGDGPPLSTTMTLTPSEGTGIGQSMRIHEAWNVNNSAPGWNNVNFSEFINKLADDPPQQTTWASIYDIPYPLPSDVGRILTDDYGKGRMGGGAQNLVYPEINISLKIDNLLPAPALDMTDGGVVGTKVRTYGSENGVTVVSGSVGERTISGDTDIYKSNKTFWRSVVVTFSNYTPEEVGDGCSLDSFVKYGLERAYGVTGNKDVAGLNKYSLANGHLGPKVVTGIVIESFHATQDNAEANQQDGSGNDYISSQSYYAYSLPVCRYQSGSGHNDQTPLMSVTGGTDLFSPSGALIHRPLIGETGSDGGAPTTTIPYVKIPKGEFFNMKFVFDVQQPWTYKTGWGWWAAGNNVYDINQAFDTTGHTGVPMRAYFDTIKPEEDPDSALSGLYNEENTPFINMMLPALDKDDTDFYMSPLEDNGNSWYEQSPTGDDRRGGPEYFPRHMTIWVNNFGFAPASGSTSPFWGGTDSWFDPTYWVSDDYKWPIKSNAWTGPNPITTDVSVDSITFKHFNPSAVNMSTAVGTFSRFATMENESVNTPASTYKPNATYQFSAQNSRGNFNEMNPGQNYTLGWKDWNWFPNELAAPAGGTSTGARECYMLWNNFSTSKFGDMERMTPTVGWINVASGIGTTIGDYFDYPGYDMANKPLFITTSTSYQATQNLKQKVFIYTGNASATPGAGGVPTLPSPGTYGPSSYTNNAYINVGYEGDGDWLSTDGFTQKGFLNLVLSSGASSPADWYQASGGASPVTDGVSVPRENILTSAKILGFNGVDASDGVPQGVEGKNMIQVDNIDLFHEDLDDEYVIYRAGERVKAGSLATGVPGPVVGGPNVADVFTASMNTTAGSNIVANAGGVSTLYEGTSVSGTGIPDNAHIIYQDGTSNIYLNLPATETASASTISFNYAAFAALGYKYSVKLVERDVENNMVTLEVLSGSTILSQGIYKADDRWTDLCVADNAYQLYISPKRYWMNMMFGVNNDIRRQYENINTIAETPATGSLGTQLGSTFNEALYTYNKTNMATKGLAAVLQRPWVLGVSDPETTSFIIDEDYGYGSYDTEKDSGGEAGKYTPVLGTRSHMNLTRMVEAISPAPGQEMTLILGLNDSVSSKTVTLIGDDGSFDSRGYIFYHPQYIWEYKDELPQVNEFSVGSAFDVLAPDVNLYDLTKQSINNLKFTWNEDSDDIWYRHLIISSGGAVENKYHSASFHAPMNEADQNFKYYLYDQENVTTQDTVLDFVESVECATSSFYPPMMPDGISGYAPFFRNSQSSGVGAPIYTLGTIATGSDGEYSTSMARQLASTQTSDKWRDKWSLVVHCWPQSNSASSATRNQGMTVCGIMQSLKSIQTDAAANGPRVFVNTGNRATDIGNVTFDSSNGWNGTSTGGFDLLHVYIKDGRVCVLYNHEYQLGGYGSSTAKPYGCASTKYEQLLLSSSTTYQMDGSQPLAITIVWNDKKGTNAAGTAGGSPATTTVTSEDQFRLYVNGILEDSQSCKYGYAPPASTSPVTGPTVGGFGRANYAKFVVGGFPAGTEVTPGDGAISNITAPVGLEDDTGTNGFCKYRVQHNCFQGKIEEIILYPYEVYIPQNANEYILDTKTLDDYSATGTSGTELDYNAKLFVYDYTNVRGSGNDEVASSSPLQWKVTGV